MVGNLKSLLFYLIFGIRWWLILGEKWVVWILIVVIEGGLFFNKIDEFLLVEKLFVLIWKSVLIVMFVGWGIIFFVNVNRGYDLRYKSNWILI